MASISFTDSVGAATLTNDYPAPADRFGNWTPMTRPVGDSVTTLASGALVMVRHRTDYGAAFELAGIPVKASSGGANLVAIADRLVAHLLSGGTCSVATGDAGSHTYATCGLWPGSTPSLTLSDRTNLLWTFSVQVLNLAGSPVQMVAVYAP